MNSSYFSNTCAKCSRSSSEFVVFLEHVCKMPATAQTSLRRSGPNGRGQLSFTTISSKTTFRSQRPPRHSYDDPVPPGASSCYLQRSRQRRLSGPSNRPDILTTILSHRARPAVIYNDLVKDDFPVPARFLYIILVYSGWSKVRW